MLIQQQLNNRVERLFGFSLVGCWIENDANFFKVCTITATAATTGTVVVIVIMRHLLVKLCWLCGCVVSFSALMCCCQGKGELVVEFWAIYDEVFCDREREMAENWFAINFLQEDQNWLDPMRLQEGVIE